MPRECAYCHAAIEPGDRSCHACGAAAPRRAPAVPPPLKGTGAPPAGRSAADLPRHRFGWTAMAVLAGSAALGLLASAGGEDPPILVMLAVLGWLFPGMPAVLVWVAVKDARAFAKSPIPGIVLSLLVWFVGAIALFLPLVGGD